MPLSEELRNRLETVVADTVWAERNHAEQQGSLAQFHQELQAASEELKKLSRGENVSYDLPRMGEAYALWYHMRRVSQIYEALEKFPQVAAPLKKGWADPWRVLDIGAGTGAGVMAMSHWANDLDGADAVGRTVVDCLEPAAPMRTLGSAVVTQMAETGEPVVEARWLNAGLDDDADFDAAGYHLILCSTTFDYLEEGTWDRDIREIVSFLHARLKPGGCVVFLAPNRGYDAKSKKQGPKVRFVKKLISEASFKAYVKRDVVAHTGPQTQIEAMRTQLCQDARQTGAGFGLGNGVPEYTTDTFSYGVYWPKPS